MISFLDYAFITNFPSDFFAIHDDDDDTTKILFTNKKIRHYFRSHKVVVSLSLFLSAQETAKRKNTQKKSTLPSPARKHAFR